MFACHVQWEDQWLGFWVFLKIVYSTVRPDPQFPWSWLVQPRGLSWLVLSFPHEKAFQLIYLQLRLHYFKNRTKQSTIPASKV